MLRSVIRPGVKLFRSHRRRRRLAVMAAIALADAAYVSLYQIGILRRVPDLPMKSFDSNKVMRSKSAYLLGLPDAVVAVSFYGLVLTLASVKANRFFRHRRHRSALLAGVVGAGSLASLGYLADMLFRQRRLCLYCLGAIGLTLGMAPLSLREAIES